MTSRQRRRVRSTRRKLIVIAMRKRALKAKKPSLISRVSSYLKRKRQKRARQVNRTAGRGA